VGERRSKRGWERSDGDTGVKAAAERTENETSENGTCPERN